MLLRGHPEQGVSKVELATLIAVHNYQLQQAEAKAKNRRAARAGRKRRR